MQKMNLTGLLKGKKERKSEKEEEECEYMFKCCFWGRKNEKEERKLLKFLTEHTKQNKIDFTILKPEDRIGGGTVGSIYKLVLTPYENKKEKVEVVVKFIFDCKVTERKILLKREGLQFPYHRNVIMIIDGKTDAKISAKLEERLEISNPNKILSIIMFNYGISLEEFVKERGLKNMTLLEVLYIGRGILNGAHYLNKNHICHRDLHIGNVLIKAREGRVIVGDYSFAYDSRSKHFGLEEANFDSSNPSPSSLEEEYCERKMTNFLPPDIQGKKKKVNLRKVDLYSIGKILEFLNSELENPKLTKLVDRLMEEDEEERIDWDGAKIYVNSLIRKSLFSKNYTLSKARLRSRRRARNSSIDSVVMWFVTPDLGGSSKVELEVKIFFSVAKEDRRVWFAEGEVTYDYIRIGTKYLIGGEIFSGDKDVKFSMAILPKKDRKEKDVKGGGFSIKVRCRDMEPGPKEVEIGILGDRYILGERLYVVKSPNPQPSLEVPLEHVRRFSNPESPPDRHALLFSSRRPLEVEPEIATSLNINESHDFFDSSSMVRRSKSYNSLSLSLSSSSLSSSPPGSTYFDFLLSEPFDIWGISHLNDEESLKKVIEKISDVGTGKECIPSESSPLIISNIKKCYEEGKYQTTEFLLGMMRKLEPIFTEIDWTIMPHAMNKRVIEDTMGLKNLIHNGKIQLAFDEILKIEDNDPLIVDCLCYSISEIFKCRQKLGPIGYGLEILKFLKLCSEVPRIEISLICGNDNYIFRFLCEVGHVDILEEILKFWGIRGFSWREPMRMIMVHYRQHKGRDPTSKLILKMLRGGHGGVNHEREVISDVVDWSCRVVFTEILEYLIETYDLFSILDRDDNRKLLEFVCKNGHGELLLQISKQFSSKMSAICREEIEVFPPHERKPKENEIIIDNNNFQEEEEEEEEELSLFIPEEEEEEEEHVLVQRRKPEIVEFGIILLQHACDHNHRVLVEYLVFKLNVIHKYIEKAVEILHEYANRYSYGKIKERMKKKWPKHTKYLQILETKKSEKDEKEKESESRPDEYVKIFDEYEGEGEASKVEPKEEEHFKNSNAMELIPNENAEEGSVDYFLAIGKLNGIIILRFRAERDSKNNDERCFSKVKLTRITTVVKEKSDLKFIFSTLCYHRKTRRLYTIYLNQLCFVDLAFLQDLMCAPERIIEVPPPKLQKVRIIGGEEFVLAGNVFSYARTNCKIVSCVGPDHIAFSHLSRRRVCFLQISDNPIIRGGEGTGYFCIKLRMNELRCIYHNVRWPNYVFVGGKQYIEVVEWKNKREVVARIAIDEYCYHIFLRNIHDTWFLVSAGNSGFVYYSKCKPPTSNGEIKPPVFFYSKGDVVKRKISPNAFSSLLFNPNSNSIISTTREDHEVHCAWLSDRKSLRRSRHYEKQVKKKDKLEQEMKKEEEEEEEEEEGENDDDDDENEICENEEGRCVKDACWVPMKEEKDKYQFFLTLQRNGALSVWEERCRIEARKDDETRKLSLLDTDYQPWNKLVLFKISVSEFVIPHFTLTYLSFADVT